MENLSPIYYFIFLFSYSQFLSLKDCVKLKKRNTTYLQPVPAKGD